MKSLMLFFSLLLASNSFAASECANQEAKELMTGIINYYRSDLDMLVATEEDLFVKKQRVLGVNIISSVSFETIADLEYYLFNHRIVRDTDRFMHPTKNLSYMIAWTLRWNLSMQNGNFLPYPRSTPINEVFPCIDN